MPGAAGLHVLVGARPARLLERLNDPDDSDPVVAAAECLTLYNRTPLDRRGRPSAPTTIYIEWDSSHPGRVRDGLRRLGVTLTGRVAVALLGLQSTLDCELEHGQQLDISPGRNPHLWPPASNGQWQWVPQEMDQAWGFYRYARYGGFAYVWLDKSERLTLVQPDIGRWLARLLYGQNKLPTWDRFEKRLLCPVNLALPTLIGRPGLLALGLRLPRYTRDILLCI